ncbi:universal stress protein [bacterium]|nr:universal stress protein [bacterium]
MFKHLLVPLDGTPQAEAAVDTAAALAARSGARVTLLHVIESGAPESVHGQRHLRTREEARPYLESVARRFPAGVKVSLHVHEESIEDVAASLADHEGELSPDLLVMCAHGGPRMRDILHGNLAQQTLARGATPILLLKGGAPASFGQVLAPLDGNPEHDERSLPVAAGIAAMYGAGLSLLYVVPEGVAQAGRRTDVSHLLPGASQALLDLEEQEAVAYVERRLAEVRPQVEQSRGAIARGRPVDRIGEYARDQRADLVVLSTHGRAGTQAFWSASVASRLVSRLETALLLIPAGR